MALSEEQKQRFAKMALGGTPLATPPAVQQVPGIQGVGLQNAPVIPPVQFNQARPDGTQAAPFGVTAAPQGRQAKPAGTTPTAPQFSMPAGGSLTGRGGARRGAELGLTAPTQEQPEVAPTMITPPTQEMQGPQAPNQFAPQTPSGLGGALTAGFNMASQPQNQTGAMSVQETQDELQRRFGAPTVSGNVAPPSMGLETDPQGRMIPSGFEARAEAFPSFEQASAEREARAAAEAADMGRAISDRERRGAGNVSTADMQAIAKAQDPRASASERARGMQVAEQAGLDWKTGQPLQTTGGLTPYQAISAAQKQQEIDLKVQAGMDEKAAKAEVDQTSALTNVRATQDAVDKLTPVAREIATLSGTPFTEGALGWVASKLPMATDASQIERLSKELEGTTFLQGLIEAKAKGATFGALSEREGDRILAARGKLIAPNSTNEQRISAINDMMGTIQGAATRASQDYTKKYGEPTQDGAAPESAQLQPGQVRTSTGKTYTIR